MAHIGTTHRRFYIILGTAIAVVAACESDLGRSEPFNAGLAPHDSGAGDSGITYDASDSRDAALDGGFEKVVLPRQPRPTQPTILRLINDSDQPVQLLAGCNAEDWLSVELLRDKVPMGACACEYTFSDGTCHLPDRNTPLMCQSFWYDELAPGESLERTVRPEKLTWFDSVGCYIWEGLPDGETLEVRASFPNAGVISKSVPYGTELVEFRVSEAVK